MRQLGLKAALFTVLNKDTAALYHELILIKPEIGQHLIERAIDIADTVDKGQLPARIEDQRECRVCSFAAPCKEEA